MSLLRDFHARAEASNRVFTAVSTTETRPWLFPLLRRPGAIVGVSLSSSPASIGLKRHYKTDTAPALESLPVPCTLQKFDIYDLQNYVAPSAGYKGHHMLNYNQNSQGHGSAQYLPRGLPMSPHGEIGMQGLTNNMAALNMHASYGSSATSKSASSALSGGSSDYGNIPLSNGQGLWVPNQHVIGSMYQMVPGAQQQAGMATSPGMYNHTGTYVQQAAYPYGQGVVDSSAMPPVWAARMSSAEMPSLMTPRRDSISSNENDNPGTPYGSGGIYRYGNNTAIMDRSPNALYTSSATPSPSQLAHPYQVMAPIQKQQTMPTLPPHLLALVHQEPPIPRAIPAPSSPHKPLDRSLENKTGETNVYIRGLLPETTDEMLHTWGKRFGDIQSSKSIIDLKTNLCKGFGFIKYHNFEDAEDCIRGFHYLGYEVSFARESFYSKLKKFADECNTNLYVSNIPKNMNEHELASIFAPHKVCSSRILRDSSGTGRGVGFARFESRDICDDVIKEFNNTPVSKPGGEEHLIQIRFSDTHEQKMLKQQTAAGRVFRAAEYEVGVAQARALGTPDRYLSVSPIPAGHANEFEMFMRGQRQPWSPPVPSTLGPARSSVYYVAQGGPIKSEDGASENGVNIKTNPATPVKADDKSASPSRLSTRND
ncbi:rna-binding domain-containing protein [Stemphylium lycopersici]|nr:rna-binding domain-containing protein [Stemphylium lycopersici]